MTARKARRPARRNHHGGAHDPSDRLGEYVPPLTEWVRDGAEKTWRHRPLGWYFRAGRRLGTIYAPDIATACPPYFLNGAKIGNEVLSVKGETMAEVYENLVRLYAGISRPLARGQTCATQGHVPGEAPRNVWPLPARESRRNGAGTPATIDYGSVSGTFSHNGRKVDGDWWSYVDVFDTKGRPINGGEALFDENRGLLWINSAEMKWEYPSSGTAHATGKVYSRAKWRNDEPGGEAIVPAVRAKRRSR